MHHGNLSPARAEPPLQDPRGISRGGPREVAQPKHGGKDEPCPLCPRCRRLGGAQASARVTVVGGASPTQRAFHGRAGGARWCGDLLGVLQTLLRVRLFSTLGA